MRIKNIVINAVVLITVFAVAVLVFTRMTNKGYDTMTADMGAATLPQVYFSAKEYKINLLSGYTEDMDLTAVRDSITPVYNQRLNLTILPYENKITGISYKVYTLDGKKELAGSRIDKISEQVALDLSGDGLLDEERILKLTLSTDTDKNVDYYTRIAADDSAQTEQGLAFAGQFHEDEIKKGEGNTIADYLESETSTQTNDLSHVTIKSSYDDVTWGDTKPAVQGRTCYTVTESRANYSSIRLQYQVTLGDDPTLYNVEEFFKVRYMAERSRCYLLEYDRTMNQVFDGGSGNLTRQGIVLGVADGSSNYMVNEDGTAVSFVQGDAVWNYNMNSGEMSQVFSFVDAENDDLRNRNRDHRLKLLGVDAQGNTTFAVYGYMNRGRYEGKVGAAVYYYDINKNYVDEQLFISSNGAPDGVVYELGQMAYYSVTKNVFYTMIDGTLYKVPLDGTEKEKVISDLKAGQYVLSANGEMLAYESAGDEKGAAELTILNLENDEKQTVKAEKGMRLKPLGFIHKDFVCGEGSPEDAGTTTLGESVTPLRKIEIRSEQGKVIKTYQEDGVYTVSAQIDRNMITLSRVTKSGDVYTPIADDYIVNNEEKEAGSIKLEQISGAAAGRQYRLTFAGGIKDTDAKLLQPKQVLHENPLQISFDQELTRKQYYVYAHGRLTGIFAEGGQAIAAAAPVNGVVTRQQQYVWESGNRALNYTMRDMDSVIADITAQLNDGKAPLDIMAAQKGYDAVNLTGAQAGDILYVLAQGRPVLAMLKNNTTVILTGYNEKSVFYRSADDASARSMTYAELDAQAAAYVGNIPSE